MQEKNKTRTNKARTEATRAALIAAGRELFAEKGYAQTSTPDIVRAAGVTRGALYHHFEDKKALFRAVIVAEAVAVADEITKSATRRPGSAVEALRQGSRGYLKAMDEPGRVRIMLLDGPAVLGELELVEITRETSSDTLRIGLSKAMEMGEICVLPIDALSNQLSAVHDRAALAISVGADKKEHLSVLDTIYSALAKTN